MDEKREGQNQLLVLPSEMPHTAAFWYSICLQAIWRVPGLPYATACLLCKTIQFPHKSLLQRKGL
jgi:hypothetical protein